MFVDLTPERARERAVEAAAEHFRRAAADPTYPQPREYGFESPEEMARVLEGDALDRTGAPDLIEVPA